MSDPKGTAKNTLIDIQSQKDERNIVIENVGVKDIRMPVNWHMDGEKTPTVVTANMYVGLPAEQKGTHMSRFLEVLEEQLNELNSDRQLHTLFPKMLEKLDANTGRIELEFPYFRKKKAPVSGVESYLDYRVSYKIFGTKDDYRIEAACLIPVKSLCPCSKEISKYGAHNQRSHIWIHVHSLDTSPTPEQIIDLAESCGSSQVYGILKRPDEKYVTEKAYENPKFVEDIIRDIAFKLSGWELIDGFKVTVENFESIHNHSAYADLSMNW